MYSITRYYLSKVKIVAQNRELVKGNIESLLLSLLLQQPMYGYQIIKVLEEQSEGYFKFKEGTLYPILHRLENMGLITSQWQTLSGGRQRRYYYITDSGRHSFSEKKDQLWDFITAMNRIIQPVQTQMEIDKG